MKKANYRHLMFTGVIGAVLLLVWYPLTIFALPMSYEFAGAITKLDQDTLDNGLLKIGDIFTGSFTFEPDDLKYDSSPDYDSAVGNLQTGDLDGFSWEMTCAGFSWQSHISTAETSLFSIHDAKIIQGAYDADRLSFSESHNHSDPVQGPPSWEFFFLCHV